MKKLEFGIKPEFVWSYSKLRLFQTCKKAYYLQYIKRPRAKIHTIGPLAMGSFLHKKVETFYTGRRFKSAETYANAMKGQWLHLTKENEENESYIYGNRIKWFNDRERLWLAKDIKDISTILYSNYINKDPPISTEYKFNFIIGHREFEGNIDEIRQNYIIRDHKTDKKQPSQATLNSDLQFTFYALAFCCISRLDKKFALKHGVTEGDIETFGGNPNYISDKVTIEYHHMKTGEIPKTKRTSKHFEDLCSILDDTEDKIRRNEFIPNLSNCYRCRYDEICDRKLPELREPYSSKSYMFKPKSQQLYLFTPLQQKEKIRTKNLRIIFLRKRKTA